MSLLSKLVLGFYFNGSNVARARARAHTHTHTHTHFSVFVVQHLVESYQFDSSVGFLAFCRLSPTFSGYIQQLFQLVPTTSELCAFLLACLPQVQNILCSQCLPRWCLKSSVFLVMQCWTASCCRLFSFSCSVNITSLCIISADLSTLSV